MYNEESMFNKRLSMDKEQLMWRLESTAKHSTPGLHRSASHPVPTGGSPCTPLMARCGARADVVTSTPGYRPLSQTFNKFGPDDIIYDNSHSSDE